VSRETAHMAAAEIGFDQLAELLQLPKDVRLVGLQWNVQRDSVLLKLEGPSLPLVRHGEILQTIIPLSHSGPRRLEWPTS
jgi:hypothetical protein